MRACSTSQIQVKGELSTHSEGGTLASKISLRRAEHRLPALHCLVNPASLSVGRAALASNTQTLSVAVVCGEVIGRSE